MRAILIDPTNQSVGEVDYNGDYQTIARWIGAESGLFTLIRLGDEHVLYVDDEGLLVRPNPNGYFRLAGFPQVLAGKGLIVGTDQAGEDTPATAKVPDVKSVVTFIDNPAQEDIEPRIEVFAWGERRGS